MERQINIDISTRTVIRVLLIIFAFIAVVWFLGRTSDALRLIGLALFLAIALNSSVNFFAKKLPGKSRILATSVSYLLVVTVLGGLVFSIVPTMYRETSQFINSLPQYIEEAQRDDTAIGSLIDRYGLQEPIDNSVRELKQNTSQIAGFAFTGVGKITDSLISILTVLVLTFLMLIEAPRWQRRFWSFYASKKRKAHHQDLANRMYRVITGYVNGQVSIAAIAGASSLIVLLILSTIFPIQSSLALPLAGVIFVTGLVPMVGATIGGTLVSLFLALYSLPAALSFAVFFIAYQQLENYVMQPIIQSRAIEISALVVFASAIIGFYLMGAVGGFIAIPIAGCVRILLIDYFYSRKASSKSQQAKNKELQET